METFTKTYFHELSFSRMKKLKLIHNKQLAELGLVNNFCDSNHHTLRRSGPQQEQSHTVTETSLHKQQPSTCSELGAVLGERM
jgi:hypothetical protein